MAKYRSYIRRRASALVIMPIALECCLSQLAISYGISKRILVFYVLSHLNIIRFLNDHMDSYLLDRQSISRYCALTGVNLMLVGVNLMAWWWNMQNVVAHSSWSWVSSYGSSTYSLLNVGASQHELTKTYHPNQAENYIAKNLFFIKRH